MPVTFCSRQRVDLDNLIAEIDEPSFVPDRA
jgi:hypothetical protein